MSSISAVPRLDDRITRLEAAHRRIHDLVRTESLLRDRISELEAEVQECRRLQTRVAEVTDFVVEVLVPAADRDDERLRRALQTYERNLL